DFWFGQLYSPPRARLATAEDLIASMDEAGIDLSIACGFPWRDIGLCQYHNDYMAAAARTYPDRIAWLAIGSPACDGIARMIEDAFGRGASGVGELNADAQDFDLREPERLQPLVEVCIAHDRPVMIHASEPVGHDYPGKGAATPDRFLRFLSAYPDLRVVAAHWGGGLPFYELMPEVRLTTVNLSYDSAASTYLYDHSVFETTAQLVGADRILFASDYPVLRQGPILQKCRQRPWADDAVRAAVLGENAIRVYRLEEKFT
ncbi:MAG: amidohydrolase, partial [Thermomicrobiales bacterium]|nr:amidohydrolase [Thermomicrobiales bacterium]